VLAQIEELIRKGEFQEAEKLLRRARPSKIRRQDACAIANAARRVDLPLIAVRILNPIVRPEDQLQAPATDFEKIEYAECLRRLGIIHEAWQILQTVSPKDHPQVLLHQTFCLFNQWNYKDAIALLKDYSQDPRLPLYARLVGKVNLAAAFIYEERIEEADHLLAELRRDTQALDHKLLHGNCLELSCQLRLLQKEWTAAIEFIEESTRILNLAGKMQSLIARKWLAIAHSFQDSDRIGEITEIRDKAFRTRHWETMRDCDFYLARLTGNQDLFRHLYFGTPFESFRQRILRTADHGFSLPDHYLWSQARQPAVTLNLVDGHIKGPWPGRALSLGQSVHRFLMLLARDFYRPLPVLSAFAGLFPDEYINPLTSANRVHQVVLRSRQWLKENHFPAEIEEIDGAYRLVLKDKAAVRIELLPPESGSRDLQWSRLKSHFQERFFSIREAADLMDCSISSAQRILRWGLQKDEVKKTGRSSDIRYQIKKPKSAA
jgi:hypothetical protein